MATNLRGRLKVWYGRCGSGEEVVYSGALIGWFGYVWLIPKQ
jgi:hypothetical protein